MHGLSVITLIQIKNLLYNQKSYYNIIFIYAILIISSSSCSASMDSLDSLSPSSHPSLSFITSGRSSSWYAVLHRADDYESLLFSSQIK